MLFYDLEKTHAKSQMNIKGKEFVILELALVIVVGEILLVETQAKNK